MDNTIFAVGQKWMDRAGREVEVTNIYEKERYPLMTTHGLHLADGRYFDHGGEDPRDLVTLTLDVPAQTPVADSEPVVSPATAIKVGQMWERRDGSVVRIAGTSGTIFGYPVSDDFGRTYTFDGFYIESRQESTRDLIRLAGPRSAPSGETSEPAVATAPNAEVIADGLLQDAHDAITADTVGDQSDYGANDNQWIDFPDTDLISQSDLDRYFVDELIYKMLPLFANRNYGGWPETMMECAETIVIRRKAILTGQAV